MNWVLEKHVNIKEIDSLNLSSGGKMMGNLCHKIVEKLYTENSSFDVESATSKAGELYDKLLPSMASELLMDGKDIERKRNKESVVGAIRSLAENVNRLGLSFDKAEETLMRDFKTSFGTIPFEERVDLILKTASGEPFILDLKWSNPKKLKDKIENGEAVQLASYTWLLKAKSADVGYFMLTNGELLSDSTLLGENALSTKRTLNEVWAATQPAWENDFKNLSDGIIDVKGVQQKLLEAQEDVKTQKIKHDHVQNKLRDEAEQQGSIYIDAPCKYCSYKILCGINLVAKEAEE
jgi:hypothetical protein